MFNPKLSAIDLKSATGFDCNCDLADIFSPIYKSNLFEMICEL